MGKIKTEYKFDGSVLRIILDDGKANIIDKAMMSELNELLVSLKENKDIKLITFEGEGKNFSFGASVAEHKKEFAAEMIENFHQLFINIIDLNIPTAALISGQCLGGGMELALVCNFIFADTTAKFGQPEIVLGVFAPPASIMLPLKIGNTKSDELLLTGKIITAEEAKAIGLINEIYVNKEDMIVLVDDWTKKFIIPKSASSLKFANRTARASFNFFMKKNLPAFADIYVNELMETEDANEGINSFMEKRKAVWKNC